MTRQSRANKIRKILNELYPEPKVPLIHQDSYTLLIAVLLSAHCTDARVNKVTPELFSRANTPEEMIKLRIDEIEEIIRTCGLFKQKSKAIWNLSRILIEKHAGKVPDSFEELEKLPGVGHKTASVVMSQAFHQFAFPVDTHIHRCAKRWGLSEGKTVKQTEKDLKELFPKKNGIVCTFKSSILAGNFAWPGVMMQRLVPSAAFYKVCNKLLSKPHLIDFFRNSIQLLKLPFLASLSTNFSTICKHMLSKLVDKSAQKSSTLSTKANFERSLMIKMIIFTVKANFKRSLFLISSS